MGDLQVPLPIPADAELAVDPTLIVHDNLTEIVRTQGANTRRGGGEMDMFNPLTRLFQQSSYDAWAASKDEHRIQLNDFLLQCLRIFHEEGVRLMVGTDAGVMVTLPGSSVTRELELFVEAGFAPLEVLESATTVPAQVLGLGSELGQIRVGYRADMILVDGDPAVDVSVVEHPVGVMAGGIWLDQTDLGALHEAARNPSLFRSLRHFLHFFVAK